MICEVIQRKSGFSVLFEINSNNTVIANAYLNNNIVFGGTWDYCENGTLKYRLVYKPLSQLSNIMKNAKDKVFVSYDIQNEREEVIGSVCQRQIGGNIFKRYEYFELKINNVSYQLYAVGMGKEGYKFPIYIDEEQVALIEKDNTIYNNLDSYKICAIDFSSNEVSCLYSLYIDALMFGNRGEKVLKSASISYNLTTNKVLKSKYNPQFKEFIK